MSDKLCIDCIYQNNDDPMQECLQCRQKNNWSNKWQSKCCASCKHAPENPIEEPCLTCGNYSNWKPDNDPVNHPSHYTQGGIECIDAIEAATTNLQGIEAVCTANIVKYAWRWKEKNGSQDIKKVIWYAKKLLEAVYGISD